MKPGKLRSMNDSVWIIINLPSCECHYSCLPLVTISRTIEHFSLTLQLHSTLCLQVLRRNRFSASMQRLSARTGAVATRAKLAISSKRGPIPFSRPDLAPKFRGAPATDSAEPPSSPSPNLKLNGTWYIQISHQFFSEYFWEKIERPWPLAESSKKLQNHTQNEAPQRQGIRHRVEASGLTHH